MNLEKIKVLTELRESLKDKDGFICGKYSGLECSIINLIKNELNKSEVFKTSDILPNDLIKGMVDIFNGLDNKKND